ncbi:MAG: 2-hydroxyacyl-CoA dehydratase [Desulfobacterales bacterium]|nr:2-hydroxyacyl-CoA dehydratase [Desulfobacterales bacterium]MBF0397152.1 2-hydroxyacyl-CoA dehydratase [Desulfobacterales bacterium]
MSKEFIEIATKINYPLLSDWKSSGKKIVGYTCSFLPPEIFHAAGILPIRLRGIETESLNIADAYYGPFVCTFPKCLLQLAGEGKYSFLDGAVISTGCDAMRRLDECWRSAGKDYPNAIPSFFYYFDIPHKSDNHALKWFEDEIKLLIKAISNNFGVNISTENLQKSISIYNKGRRLLLELENLRMKEGVNITGEEAFAASISANLMPREDFNKSLSDWISDINSLPELKVSGKKRIMLIGSVNDDIDLVRLIEKAGALVVAENLCFGIRSEKDIVREDIEPIHALSYRYLSNSICPRMFGGYLERKGYLLEKVKSARIDGVIMQNIRFCDLHSSENGLFERDLEDAGIPSIRLEKEYGPLTETGRLRMRIDAFLERISK